jgi:serine/threonine protein kinase
MATRTKQGSDQYIAPEILRGRPYWSTVDIWGIGCLVYELFAGHRIFNTRSEIEAYDSGQRPLPQLHFPYPAGILGVPVPVSETQVKANQFAFQILSGSKRYLGTVARNQLDDFWKAFRAMPGTEMRMTGEVCADVLGRLREINGLLKWLLDCDPAKRPSIQVVVHHLRGNYLRSMLENDDVQPPTGERLIW